MGSAVKKYVWSENEFGEMTWHDCKIYAIAFDNSKFELYLDIDYILKWIAPNENDYYKFKVVPSTLFFRNVYDLNINIHSLDVQIQEISRESPTSPKNREHIQDVLEYVWRIETTAGEINFKSVGFRQCGRRSPEIADRQSLDITLRGGISFDIIA